MLSAWVSVFGDLYSNYLCLALLCLHPLSRPQPQHVLIHHTYFLASHKALVVCYFTPAVLARPICFCSLLIVFLLIPPSFRNILVANKCSLYFYSLLPFLWLFLASMFNLKGAVSLVSNYTDCLWADQQHLLYTLPESEQDFVHYNYIRRANTVNTLNLWSYRRLTLYNTERQFVQLQGGMCDLMRKSCTSEYWAIPTQCNLSSLCRPGRHYVNHTAHGLGKREGLPSRKQPGEKSQDIYS